MKPIEAVYIYDKDLGTLKQVLGCRYDRMIFAQYTPNEKVHYYAENPAQRVRIEIAEKSEEVFEDRYKNSLVVWLHELNRDKAIEIIGNYILDQVGSEIRTHESFIRRLQKDRAKAYRLLETLPEV